MRGVIKISLVTFTVQEGANDRLELRISQGTRGTNLRLSFVINVIIILFNNSINFFNFLHLCKLIVSQRQNNCLT